MVLQASMVLQATIRSGLADRLSDAQVQGSVLMHKQPATKLQVRSLGYPTSKQGRPFIAPRLYVCMFVCLFVIGRPLLKSILALALSACYL